MCTRSGQVLSCHSILTALGEGFFGIHQVDGSVLALIAERMISFYPNRAPGYSVVELDCNREAPKSIVSSKMKIGESVIDSCSLPRLWQCRFILTADADAIPT